MGTRTPHTDGVDQTCRHIPDSLRPMDFEAFDEQRKIAMLALLASQESSRRKVRLDNRQRHYFHYCIGGQTATPLGGQSGKPPKSITRTANLLCRARPGMYTAQC
jgi:hypothetical protein